MSIVTIVGYTDSLYAGSLLQDNGRFFVGLGDHIHRVENHKVQEYRPVDPSIIYTSLLSVRALRQVHDMVYTRYSSYHTVVPLFLGSSIKHVVLYMPGTKKGHKKNATIAIHTTNQKITQTIHIFPTLYTLYQYIYTLNIDPVVVPDYICILSGTSTVVQRTKTFWGIKTGRIADIYATGSKIFWDWCGSVDVILHYPDSGYYIPSHDPRYRIQDVVSYIQQAYTTSNEIVVQSV